MRSSNSRSPPACGLYKLKHDGMGISSYHIQADGRGTLLYDIKALCTYTYSQVITGLLVASLMSSAQRGAAALYLYSLFGTGIEIRIILNSTSTHHTGSLAQTQLLSE